MRRALPVTSADLPWRVEVDMAGFVARFQIELKERGIGRFLESSDRS
jgi:hypothetical protein